MKSESPAPKGRQSPAPQILAASRRLARNTGRMGTQIRGRRSRGFPRRPRHKSANRGDRRPQRRNNMDGNQRPPFRHQRPRNHHRLVDVATGCPNRRPNTQRRGGARYRPPPRRPRHLGHHRRRSRSTGHTPSRFRPQRRRFSHLVSEPRTVTNSRTVTESTCCTMGTDTAFCRHRYTQKPASRTPGFTTRQHRWRTYRNG